MGRPAEPVPATGEVVPPRSIRERFSPRIARGYRRNRVAILTFVLIVGFGVLLQLLFGGSLPQVLVTGIVIGSVYVLGATGLSLLYGIKKFANFAHGDLITLGAYVAFFISLGPAPDIVAGITVLVALLAVAGVFLDTLVARDLHGKIRAGPLVGSIVVQVAVAAFAAGAVLQRLSGAPSGGFEFVLLVCVASAAVLLMKVQIVREGGRGSWKLTGSLLLQSVVLLAASVVLVKLAAGILHLVLGLAISILVLSFVGIVLEVLVFHKFEGKGVVAPLIASVGVAIVVQNIVNASFGTEPMSYSIPRVENWVTPWFQIHPIRGALILGVSITAVALLHIMLTRTTLGKSMRATSDNTDLARSSGINTRNITLWTWAISCMLAALAGVLLAIVVDVRPLLGFNILLFLFAAVIIGGIGSPYGAMIGGFAVGMIQETSSLLLDWLARPDVIGLEAASAYRPMAAFAVMIIVLLVKPEGLLGTPSGRAARGAMLRTRLFGV